MEDKKAEDVDIINIVDDNYYDKQFVFFDTFRVSWRAYWSGIRVETTFSVCKGGVASLKIYLIMLCIMKKPGGGDSNWGESKTARKCRYQYACSR